MNSEELKERLISVLQEGAARGGIRRTCSYEEQRYGKILITVKQDVTEVEINFDVFADTLIAAGLRFGENLTATFDHMALEREHDLERRLAEAEHRAELAERALDKATELAYEYRTEMDTLSCSSCPVFDDIFPRCKDRGLYKECSKRWKELLIEQAEKELEEGRKDEQS